MKSFEDFDNQVADYTKTLTDFIATNSLPFEWFMFPDHLAVKAANGDDFNKLIELWKLRSDRITCVEMDGRRLAAAQLSGSISVGAHGEFGVVEWLEIMEPRPEKVGKGVVGLEHMEFYVPSLTVVDRALSKMDVPHTMQENDGHRWANIVLNSAGQEVKINDKSLAKVVAHELETIPDRVHVLYSSQS